MTIENAFKACENNEKNDKEVIKALKSDINLIDVLRKFYKETISKKAEDTRILFNWFIGSNFNICLNDL